MKTIAIITSRWHSTRLQGKALADIRGKPLLQWVIDGAREAELVDEVIVATTFNSSPIKDYCAINNIPFTVGRERDLLGRLNDCAYMYNADLIVRLWGDCPLIYGNMIDNAIREYHISEIPKHPQYFSYKDTNTGYIIAILPFELLEKCHKTITNPHDREWIHKYLNDNVDFSVEMIIEGTPPLFSLSVDTEEDLERIRELVSRKNNR